jgi:hypothetical protein
VEEALEPAYAKIFLKKYASYLGLDGSALLQEYLAVHGPLPESPISVQTQVTKKEDATGIRAVLVPAGAGLMALIGLSFLGYLAFDFYGTVSQSKERPQASRRMAKALPAVEKVAAGPKLIVPRSQTLKLTIRAKADVWMQVKSDGAVIFQNVLHRGQAESWNAKENLELWTGNAGAMELFLNGKPLEGVGTGVKKGIRVTHEGLKE